MDPYRALNDLREAIKEYNVLIDNDTESAPRAAIEDTLERLVRAAEALDGWMSKGGFSPWPRV